MQEFSKSIWVGTVDFFGILIPGVLVIMACTVGFVLPLGAVILDLCGVPLPSLDELNGNLIFLVLFLLVVFSYLFGYILRLSSPDQLDRKSAVKVIRGEYLKHLLVRMPIAFWEWCTLLVGRPVDPGKSSEDVSREDKPEHEIEKPRVLRRWFDCTFVSWNSVQDWIDKDAWPFDPSNPRDKYPYLGFRRYLGRRGHSELASELVKWEENSSGPTVEKQRSKSYVNRMKLTVRRYCPELSLLIESKEAHVRLMAGTWAAFRFAQWPIWLALLVTAAASFQPAWLESLPGARPLDGSYYAHIFANLNLLAVIFFCNRRIEKLFHYRRVSELFHIVQAAYFAEQARKKDAPAEVTTRRTTPRRPRKGPDPVGARGNKPRV